MGNIQFISVSPEELVNLINENLKLYIEEYSKLISEPQEKGKEFLSRKETADFFGISLVCLHDWVNKEILKNYKVGNRTYFKRSELVQTLLDSNKQLI